MAGRAAGKEKKKAELEVLRARVRAALGDETPEELLSALDAEDLRELLAEAEGLPEQAPPEPKGAGQKSPAPAAAAAAAAPKAESRKPERSERRGEPPEVQAQAQSEPPPSPPRQRAPERTAAERATAAELPQPGERPAPRQRQRSEVAQAAPASASAALPAKGSGGYPSAGSAPRPAVVSVSAEDRLLAAAELRRGLVNLGNTCFLNSVVQCLNASGPFSSELARLSGEGLGSVGRALCDVFEDLRRPKGQEAAAPTAADGDVLVLERTGGAPVTPTMLLERLAEHRPEYKAREQQDAHELLQALLGIFSEELTQGERAAKAGAGGTEARLPSGAGSLCEEAVWRTFRGQLLEARLCWECCRVSTRLEPFLDLSVDLPEDGTRLGPLGVSVVAEQPLVEVREEEAGPEAQSAAEGDGGEEALEAEDKAAPPDDATHEVQLSRPRAGRRVPWGFQWEERLREGKLVVAGVTPGSLLDKWHNSPENGAAGPVRPGDLLVSANRECNEEDIRPVLKDAFDVTFRLKRLPEAPAVEAQEEAVAEEEEEEADSSRPIFTVEHSRKWAAELKSGLQAAGLTKKDVRVLDRAGSTVDPFLSPPDASRFPLSFWRLAEPSAFEVAIERSPAAGGKPVPWGFRWSEEHLRKGLLVLTPVPEDSPAGRWNATCLGERKALALQPGDVVVSANGERNFEKIRAIIKSANQLKLKVRHPPGTACPAAPAGRAVAGAGAQAEAAAAAGGEEADSWPEDARFDVQLERQGDDAERGKWGFEWNEERAKEGGLLVVATVLGGSLLEDWNAKCQALGAEERTVSQGDRLLVVNGESSQREMLRALKNEARVTLTFARGRWGRARLRELEAADSFGEIRAAEKAPQLPPARLAERERLRQGFCEAARGCHERLPPELRALFAAEAEARGPGAPGAAASSAAAPDGAPARTGERSLVDCLGRFAAVEALEDGYRPMCSCAECGRGPRFASKRTWLWPTLPPILAVQLKRFRYHGGALQKISLRVNLPAELDLGAFLLGGSQREVLAAHLAKEASLPSAGPPVGGGGAPLYELYGVCMHRGRTMQRGHYLAFANLGPSLARERWLSFDDARAWPCSREDVLRAQAYIAFYRRRG